MAVACAADEGGRERERGRHKARGEFTPEGLA